MTPCRAPPSTAVCQFLTESGLVREVDVGRDYKYYMANARARTFQAQLHLPRL